MTNQEKQLWFKRRRYGYGWTPVTWQGWVLVILTLVVAIGGAALLVILPYTNQLLWVYLTSVITIVVLLVIVAYQKGPSPKWRWGKKPGDNSDLDF